MSFATESIPPPPPTMNGPKALSNVIVRRFGQPGDLEGVQKTYKISLLDGSQSPYSNAMNHFSHSCGAVVGLFAGMGIYGASRYLTGNPSPLTVGSILVPFAGYITPMALKRVGQILVASSTLCTGYVFYARALLTYGMNDAVKRVLNDDLKDVAVSYKLNRKNANDDDVTCFWVAELDGQVVGTIGIYPSKKGPKWGEVRRLSVHPSYQGRGIAKKLMAALTEHARAYGIEELHLNTSQFNGSAVKMYNSTGWELERRITRWFLGLKATIVYMKKSIV